jgi:hypothetical protein
MNRKNVDKLLLWFQRPLSWALAGGLAVALLALTLVVRQLDPPGPEPPMIADAGKKASESPHAPIPERIPAARPGAAASGEQRPARFGIQGYEQGNARERFYSTSALSKAPPPVGPAQRKSLEATKSEMGAGAAEQAKAGVSVQGFARSAAQPSASAKPLGLRYSLLKRGTDGTYAPVAPSAAFRAEDAARLTVEANETAVYDSFHWGTDVSRTVR